MQKSAAECTNYADRNMILYENFVLIKPSQNYLKGPPPVLPDPKRCAFFDEPVLPEKWTSETQRPRQTHYLDLVSRLSKKSSAPDNSFSLYFGTNKKCISV